MTNIQKLAFQGELMMAGWSETHNAGAKVTFWLPDSDALEPFKGMTARKGNMAGQRFAAVLVEIQDDETTEMVAVGEGGIGTVTSQEPKLPPNELAQSLHREGYFNSLKLWNAIEARGWYTQAEHVKYIESLPCLFAPVNARRYKSIATARNFTCEGEVCGHHCQSAALPSAGKDSKNPRKAPDWYRVPLCHAHHMKWGHGSNKHSASKDDKQLLVVIAVGIMAEIAERIMKAQLRIESLNELDEPMFETWKTMLSGADCYSN